MTNRNSKIKVLILLCLSLCGVNSFAESQTPADCNKTEVVIIGTIHGAHYKSPKYKPEVLKEIILALNPDAILNELPLSQVDPNGRPLHRDPQKHPEGWAADSVATQLGIRQIPFDRPDRSENFRKTNYWKRQKRANELAKKWTEGLKRGDANSLDLKIVLLWEQVGMAEYHLFPTAGPELINSEVYDSIIRAKKSLWYDIMPTLLKKHPGYETLISDYHFARDQWQERNEIIVNNITKAAKQYKGKRFVVITGASHRYILRDLLKDSPDIKLKEYWELVDFDLEKCLKSIEAKPQMGITADKLTKEEASRHSSTLRIGTKNKEGQVQ